MKTIRTMFAILLGVPLMSCASSQVGNAPVTVWYESAYVVTADGRRVQKTEAIPWTVGITITRAIASAGGYATPPHRYICIIRDGRNTLLPDPRQIVKPEDDMLLKPGDRIELRSSQNKPVEAIRR